MPTHPGHLDAMLWNLIWEALSAQFDDDRLVAFRGSEDFHNIDKNSSERGPFAFMVMGAIEDET